MPWKNTLKSLKSELEAMIKPRDEEHQQHQQQQPPPPPPPPSLIATCRPPGPSPTFHTYWVPRFHPDTPVNAEWNAKLGNADGWGNQELEHYTAAAENSFQLAFLFFVSFFLFIFFPLFHPLPPFAIHHDMTMDVVRPTRGRHLLTFFPPWQHRQRTAGHQGARKQQLGVPRAAVYLGSAREQAHL